MPFRKFFFISLLAFIYPFVVRFVGWRYFANTKIFQTMLYDNIHHYQAGFIFIMIGLLVRRAKPFWRDVLIAIGIGLVSDEFVYLFNFLNPELFNHYTPIGMMINLMVFSICLTVIYCLKTKTLIKSLTFNKP